MMAMSRTSSGTSATTVENEKRIDVPKILAVLEMAKASRFPTLAKEAEAANLDDAVRKHELPIRRTIDQLEKLDL